MIPENVYNREKRPNLTLPTTQSPIQRLSTTLEDLNKKENLSDPQRWSEYERIFNSYFAYDKKPYLMTYGSSRAQDDSDQGMAKDFLQNLFIGEDQETATKVILPIYQTLPKNVKEKGMQLIQFIAQTQPVQDGIYQISRTGQLRMHGQNIPGSNFLDLIHYAVRQKRKVSMPRGWKQFTDFLRQNNVPGELLAAHHRHSPTPSASFRPSALAHGRPSALAHGRLSPKPFARPSARFLADTADSTVPQIKTQDTDEESVADFQSVGDEFEEFDTPVGPSKLMGPPSPVEQPPEPPLYKPIPIPSSNEPITPFVSLRSGSRYARPPYQKPTRKQTGKGYNKSKANIIRWSVFH